VVELAKLASAFQILVFSIENVALVAFRESDVDFYQPEFTAPGYPVVQLVGVVGGLALLTQMGTLPIAGAVAIIVGGVGWYLVYGRSRTDRVGALSTLLDRGSGEVADTSVDP
jgi:APA family basic amino acid/polyamine antiporter